MIDSTPSVVGWYDCTVPQGPGAFTLNAASFEAFDDAIKQKLLRGISETTISYD